MDKTIFDENIIEKIDKKLSKFIDTEKSIKFKFKKLKPRKNSNPITFGIIPAVSPNTDEITDTSVITQVTNLNLTKVPSISGKLNYYRNGA